MSRLYVFAIGGTGSRVLRSLTMLLATGIKCQSEEIIPVIIDPDASAADMTRTVDLMKLYNRIRSKLKYSNSEKNLFLQTPISEQTANYKLTVRSTNNKAYKDFIGIGGMDRSNLALAQMLFSKANLNSTMDVGFKGNPNIGSVVLNQFDSSPEYQSLMNNFKQGDKIFIVSSIFGGTGASGFPLLLKTFRNQSGSTNAGVISEAIIGAITVMPYFGLSDNANSEIDSTSFATKAKSALEYYNRVITTSQQGKTGQPFYSADYLYYIGDSMHNTYDNCEGGQGQSNDAHLVELLSALAILDFDSKAPTVFSMDDGPRHTHTKEFGLANSTDTGCVNFKDFDSNTSRLLAAPMTQMMLTARYIKDHLKSAIGNQPWSKINNLDDKFFDSAFATDMNKLSVEYLNWLDELERNKRSFAPFTLDAEDPISSVRGIMASYGFLSDKGFNKVNSNLNKKTKSQNSNATPEQKFLDILYEATKDIVSDNLKM